MLMKMGLTDYRTERVRQKFFVQNHLRTLAGLSRIPQEAADFVALLHSAGLLLVLLKKNSFGLELFLFDVIFAYTPSSNRRRNSNPRPLGCKAFPSTTRPRSRFCYVLGSILQYVVQS